jgi:hypothetical protein
MNHHSETVHSAPQHESSFDSSIRLLRELCGKVDLMNADTERRVCALENYYGIQSAKITK